MGRLKRTLSGVAAAVAGGLLLAGQAQALLLDDMRFTTSSEASDPGTSPASRGTGGSGAWVSARDELYANNAGADTLRTQDCSTCQVGHTDNSPSSQGQQYWSWDGGTPVDVQGVSFNYETDIAGADFFLTLFNGGKTAGDIVAQMQWSDLAATGLTGAPPPLVNAQTLSLTYSGTITGARIDVISVGSNSYTDPTGILGTVDVGNAAIGLDVNIDNLQASVPLPGTLAMLGLGLVGLGWQRRRVA